MDIHGTVQSRYLGLKRRVVHTRLLDYFWLAEQEVNSWHHWVRLPLRRRLELYRHGFTSPCGRLYDIETHGTDAYLSEIQRNRLFRRMNGAHRYLVDDKLSQYWMLADFPDNRPQAFGLIESGLVHRIAGTGTRGDPTPVAEWLPLMLQKHSTLVVKHLRGQGGKEVWVCEYDGEFHLDGEPVSEAQLVETFAPLSGYLVTSFVRQHAYANELYPHASNTIRLFTIYDAVEGDVYVPMAVHRIGTERSRPIDNVSAGGLTARIDLETGTLGPAGQYPYDGGAVPWYSVHPDAGTQIEGTTIPHWSKIVHTIEQMALSCSNIPAIGWDVILDERGEPVVIEANTGTTFDLIQIHAPLLADPRMATIAARYLPEIEPPAVPVASAEDRSAPEHRVERLSVDDLRP